jgi:hypothetical protein
MASSPWLDKVQKRLAGQALPAAYIRRFMDELSDHLQDLTEENMSTEANASSRLGEPQEVARAAVAAYRRRSFLGRHPAAAFLVFAVSPVVLLFVGIVAVLWVVGMATGCLCPAFLDGAPKWLGWALPDALRISTLIIPSILAGVLYCRLARRLGLGMKWGLVSCVMLAALAATFQYGVRLSDVPGKSSLYLGLCIPQRAADVDRFLMHVFFGTWQTVQLAVPLAVGCWFLWRKRGENRECQPPMAV